jgi:hypothetical protein
MMPYGKEIIRAKLLMAKGYRRIQNNLISRVDIPKWKEKTRNPDEYRRKYSLDKRYLEESILKHIRTSTGDLVGYVDTSDQKQITKQYTIVENLGRIDFIIRKLNSFKRDVQLGRKSRVQMVKKIIDEIYRFIMYDMLHMEG